MLPAFHCCESVHLAVAHPCRAGVEVQWGRDWGALQDHQPRTQTTGAMQRNDQHCNAQQHSRHMRAKWNMPIMLTFRWCAELLGILGLLGHISQPALLDTATGARSASGPTWPYVYSEANHLTAPFLPCILHPTLLQSNRRPVWPTMWPGCLSNLRTCSDHFIFLLNCTSCKWT